MFGYEYVNLSPEQVEARRKSLDQAGYQAYLTPIILLMIIAVYRQPIPTTKTPNEPSLVGRLSRRLSWILETTYISEFGPLQVQLLGLLYTGYLLFRVVYQTGDDYMHVTKAFGHVAVSQLPLHYLLSIKSPKSPITWALGLTHERLNAYHRLFGRIIHAMLATHAILYLRFFAKKDLLAKRIKDSDVRLGIIAFWTVNFLGILSIPPIRAKVYHAVFYRSHVLLSALLLIVLWFHVPYTRIYVGQAAVLWVLNGVLRKGASQPATVTCTPAGKDLVRVKATTTEKHLYPYLPGVHIFLNQGGLGPRTPFTVLSARGLDKGQTEIELIAKNSGGPMTGTFGVAAAKGEKLELQLEGPYGEAQAYMPDFLRAGKSNTRKYLVVAGGVGATYALPIYKALVKTRGSTTGIKLLWVVKRAHDLEWAQDFLADKSLESGMQLAVTQKDTVEQSDGVKDLLKRSKLTLGRPDLSAVVDEFLTAKPEEGVTVMVCGPSALTKSLRKAVGKHVLERGIDVQWYEEQYGFGG